MDAGKVKAVQVTASDALLLRMVKMLDMFALLDALKNMKACLNNDFSFYKRLYFKTINV